MASHGRRAGSVTELLNKATSALNFEPGSAGTKHGGWGGVALTTVERMSAIPLAPKVGEHSLGTQPRNWKVTAHPHSQGVLQLERKSETQAQQGSVALGFVPERRARPPATNLDCTQEQPGLTERLLCARTVIHRIPGRPSPASL